MPGRPDPRLSAAERQRCLRDYHALPRINGIVRPGLQAELLRHWRISRETLVRWLRQEREAAAEAVA